MKRRREEEEQAQHQNEEKVLDVSATMQGSLRFDDPVNLRINGRFEGTLDTKGKLTIGDRAEIRANITGESIFVEGNVTGNIKASQILSMGRSARLSGDVETPSLAVQEGAVLIGQIRMESAGGAKSFQPGSGIMTLYQVAKYLEVDSRKVAEWADNGILHGKKENNDWVFDKNKIDEWVALGKVRS